MRTYNIDDLMEDSNISTVNGTIKQFIGTTLKNATSYEVIRYSKDNYTFARTEIEGRYFYAYNGKNINVEYN